MEEVRTHRSVSSDHVSARICHGNELHSLAMHDSVFPDALCNVLWQLTVFLVTLYRIYCAQPRSKVRGLSRRRRTAMPLSHGAINPD